ncbi:MAG: hypothetical protein ACYTKD_14195 [Planctomycetota bacterium]|jgi:hypothetical protein
MRDVTTMDVRYGVNETNFVCDAGGWIAAPGSQANFQSGATLVTVMSPMAYQGGFAGGGPRDDVRSLQSSIGLFNYEKREGRDDAAPSWKLHVRGKRVTKLPYESKRCELVTIDHGATYVAIMPFASEVRRDAALTIHRGEKQKSKHTKLEHAAALVINAHNLRIPPGAGEPLSRESPLWREAEESYGGFVVRLGDAKTNGSFAEFQRGARAWAVSHSFDKEALTATVRFRDGGRSYEFAAPTAHAKDGAKWKVRKSGIARRSLDGRDPYDLGDIWRDSPLTQIATGRARKAGGMVESAPPGGKRGPISVSVSPDGHTFVGWKPLPDRAHWRMKAPGAQVTADGVIGIARVVEKEGGSSIAIDHGFRPGTESDGDATAFAIICAAGRPEVHLNGEEATARLVRVDLDGKGAWALPISDGFDPGRFAARHSKARAALDALLADEAGR